jgi:ketosteroid isomerase-like protein
VDAVRRGDYLFLINHGAEDVTVAAAGTDLLAGRRTRRQGGPRGPLGRRDPRWGRLMLAQQRQAAILD